MARPSVFVTRRLPPAVEAKLSEHFEVTINRDDKALGDDDLRDVLRGFDGVLPTAADRFSERTLDMAEPRAKILANYGMGCGHIDLDTVVRQGITVTNTPDVLTECTADLTLMMMLMVARRAGEGERELRGGTWSGWRPTHLVGTKVSGKTLGIVGFGRVGEQVARRACHGFGMKVVVYDPVTPSPSRLAAVGARAVKTIDALLPQCDFVSLHCPGGEANRNLLTGRHFDLMRPGAFLINTARGELVDEQALTQALMFETIGGAALDLFDGEPRASRAILDCDNVVVLPQMRSATREAREAMGFRALENLTDFFGGREPRDRVA